MIYAEINQDCNEKEIGHRMPERRFYMGKEMIVDTEYAGYVFVGWAAGRFKTERGEMMPYANMFVLSPVSSYESDDYQAMGMKAEKKKCLSPEVWADLEPGDRVKLFFDDKNRVVMAALDQ